jgi:hypothetical protein
VSVTDGAFLADAVVGVHAAFVAFVVLGGVLALRWPRVAWLHLPAVAWGALVELAGWGCPLTPLEERLRGQGYRGGFVDRYCLPILYPDELTRPVQVALGVLVIVVNFGVYALVLHRRSRRTPRGAR